MLQGGSFNNNTNNAAASYRNNDNPHNDNNNFRVRLVVFHTLLTLQRVLYLLPKMMHVYGFAFVAKTEG